MIKSIFTAALFGAALLSAPAHAQSFPEFNQQCQLAIQEGMPAALSDTDIRFKSQRGSGKKKRISYYLTHAGERAHVLCIISRDGIKELRFSKSFQVKMAAAQP